jgi:bis(5'-nucleosyl)-tetraphosphatase (symmetrical)
LTTYFIGDVQGCCAQLELLLQKVFAHDADAKLLFAGDLVNRGPASLATLRLIKNLGVRADSVLGNHDLHLLAVANGIRPLHRKDTLSAILQAPDRDELLEWLRQRPLAIQEDGHILVHAGVFPVWHSTQIMALANEVQDVLRRPDWLDYLRQMYGNTPDHWSEQSQGIERWRCIVNAFTRMRYLTPQATMDFASKEGSQLAPPGLLPWFDHPQRQSTDSVMVCGHWSTLGLVLRPNFMALDSGCVWGGQLTAVSLHADPVQRHVIQIDCPQQQEFD